MHSSTNDSTAKSKDDEISLLELLSVLIRHKKLIALITFSAAIIVLIYAILSLLLPSEKSYLPNLYTPKAIILVATNTSGSLSSMLGDAASLASLAGVNVGGGKSNGQLALLLAKSNSTLDELNASFNFTSRYKIKNHPKTATRKAILDNLNVTYDEKTTALSISFTDRDPVFAQSVVNSAVEILDRRFSSLGGNQAIDTRNRLESKLNDVNAQIGILEGKIKDFTTKYGVLDVEAMATEQVTVLAKLRSELIMKDMEIENYEKFSKIEDPVIQRLKSERASIATKINEIERGSSVLPGQKDIPKLAFEYAALKRDLMVQTEIFKLLTQQYEMAKLSADSREPAFQILELAEVPDEKSGPSRAVTCIVATMAAFFFSIVLVFIIEGLKSLRKDPVIMKKLRGEE